MTNILLIYDVLEATFIMAERFFREFLKKYGCQFLVKESRKVKKEDLDWCDIVICVRSQSILTAGFVRLAKKRGCKCAIIIDDDFFALPDHKFRRPIEEKALLEILKTVDIVLSPNDTLGRKMAEISGRAKYIRTDTVVRDDEIYDRNLDSQEQAKLNLVYYVNDGTTEMFEKVIRPAIPLIYDKFRKRISWTFMSVHPDMKNWEEQMEVRYFERMPFDEFKQFLRINDFTVGIAPLISNGFSECKYINKFMEYSMAGIPGIYSDVEPYHSFIVDGETGILCDNHPESWVAALEKMTNRKECEKYIKNSQKKLREDFSKERIFSKVREEWPEICCYKTPQDMKIKSLFFVRLRAYFYQIVNPFIKAWRRFRREGMWSVIAWIWKTYIYNKFCLRM